MFVKGALAGGGGGRRGKGGVTEDRITDKSLKKGIYFRSTQGKVFFFHVVLHQVFLSPGNIAMYRQIFKRLPKLCTLSKFLAPPTEFNERRFVNSLIFQ